MYLIVSEYYLLFTIGKDGEVVHTHQSQGLSMDTNEPVPEWKYLQTFTKKYNKVLLDKIAIAKEKERLEIENQDLQNILRQYLDGVSVNDNVLKGANPLLIVNGKMKLNKVGPLRQITNTIAIEGNHMVASRRVG